MVQSAGTDAKTEGKAKRRERYGKADRKGNGEGGGVGWEGGEKEKASLTFMFAARVVQESEVKRD